MKNGAPVKPVMIPSGSSLGANAVLANKSVNIRNTAPAKALIGSKIL